MTTLGRLTLFCLKRARSSEDFLAELARWRDSLEDVLAAPNGVAALGAVLRYVLEASDVQPEEVRDLTKGLGPKGEESSGWCRSPWRRAFALPASGTSIAGSSA